MSLYVFGYGALLNTKEIKELNQPKKGCPVSVEGLKRSLNVGGNKHRVFGVKDVPTAHCNGILIKVNATELASLKEREKLYTIKALAKDRIKFPYKKCIKFKPADQILCFYPEAKYILTKAKLAAKQMDAAYVRGALTGAAAISAGFLQDFIDTTYGI